MRDIPDKSVDMILCDLPYGTTRNKWDTVIPLDALWVQYERVIKPNGAIALFSAEPFTSLLVASNPKLFRYDLIWAKPLGSDFLNANRKPLRAHENICIFYKAQPTYNPQKSSGKPYKKKSGASTSSNYGRYNGGFHTENINGKRYPLSVLDFAGESNKGKKHPTQKPVALLECLIKTYSNPGEVVLDNCMGSGSTGVACVNTNRNFIGIELFEQLQSDVIMQGDMMGKYNPTMSIFGLKNWCGWSDSGRVVTGRYDEEKTEDALSKALREEAERMQNESD